MEYPITFEQYQDELSKGRFLGLQCDSCHAVTFPPQGICRNCGGQQLIKTGINGEGIIQTFTVIRVPPEGMQSPYILALVELKEGAWVIGRVVDQDPDKADMGLIGQMVRLGVQAVKEVASGQVRYILTFTST